MATNNNHGLPVGARLIFPSEEPEVVVSPPQDEESQPLRQTPITGAISPEDFEQLTPEEQIEAGAGIGPNVPADVPSIPIPGEAMTSAEFAEKTRSERTLMEHLEREILPTAGSIIGPLLLATPQGRVLKGAGAALRLGKTALAAGAGGAVGEAAQMANEYLRGDMDAPENALDVASRLGKEAAWGAGGEVLGFGAVRAGNLATKAWNNSIRIVEETGQKTPVVKNLFRLYDVKRYKNLKGIYEGLTSELAERAGNNLNPKQLGDLLADTIKEGNSVANTVFKETLRQLDSNPALRTTKVVGQEATGLVDNLGNPIMKDVVEESPNAINLSAIKDFAEKRLNRFATGKTEEGFRHSASSQESKVIASSVLEELQKISDNTGFTESFVIKNETLEEAVTAANIAGNDSLANSLKAIQTRLGTVMEESAKRIGGETKEVYESIVKNREKLSDDIGKTFLRDTFIKNPGLVGSEVLPGLSPRDTLKLKNQIKQLGGEGAEMWQQAVAGYSKAIADKIIDTDTGKLNREAFKNILENPQQRQQIAAVFGKKQYEKLQDIQNTLEKQLSKPGDYLIHTGNMLGFISGVLDPATAGLISGGLAGARGIGKAKGIAVDVLGRMIRDPAKSELLMKALSMKGDSPGAARIVSQLTAAIAETIEEQGIPTDIGLAPEGDKGIPLGKVPPGARLIDPGEEGGKPPTKTLDDIEATSLSDNVDEATKHGLPPGTKFIFPPTKQPVPSQNVGSERIEKGITPEEEWIQKYQQVNPGVSRDEAIKEGKRLGKVPKNYTSPPLGVRNNNPGNIRVSNINWKGKVEGHTGPFEKFKTPEDGIRALAKNILAYESKYGLNTVEGIINRWAPPNENATGSYINTVSRYVGVRPAEKLNLNNKETMQKLVEAIIRVENGKQPYDKKTLSAAIQRASA